MIEYLEVDYMISYLISMEQMNTVHILFVLSLSLPSPTVLQHQVSYQALTQPFELISYAPDRKVMSE